ncbi:hypothetical protein [Francisella halioticida]|nr:hypothetical protein [Francisella halioticida]
MSNKRKIYTVEFKTKVVLEVLGKDQTITQLSIIPHEIVTTILRI